MLGQKLIHVSKSPSPHHHHPHPPTTTTTTTTTRAVLFFQWLISLQVKITSALSCFSYITILDEPCIVCSGWPVSYAHSWSWHNKESSIMLRRHPWQFVYWDRISNYVFRHDILKLWQTCIYHSYIILKGQQTDLICVLWFLLKTGAWIRVRK